MAVQCDVADEGQVRDAVDATIRTLGGLNVHRHSGSNWARVAIRRDSNAIRLDVSDGGCGLQTRPAIEIGKPIRGVGVGVSGMRVRLEQLQGSLEIDAGRGGTRVTATVPLAQ